MLSTVTAYYVCFLFKAVCLYRREVCVQNACLILFLLFVQIQTAMKASERITKESSQGLDQTCPVLPGETTATGRPTGSLLLSNLITFPNSTVMYKTDLHHQ